MRAHVLCLVAVLGCDSHEPARNAPAPVGSTHASAPVGSAQASAPTGSVGEIIG